MFAASSPIEYSATNALSAPSVRVQFSVSEKMVSVGSAGAAIHAIADRSPPGRAAQPLTKSLSTSSCTAHTAAVVTPR